MFTRSVLRALTPQKPCLLPFIFGGLFVFLPGYLFSTQRVNLVHMVKNNVDRIRTKSGDALPQSIRLPKEFRFLEGARKKLYNPEVVQNNAKSTVAARPFLATTLPAHLLGSLGSNRLQTPASVVPGSQPVVHPTPPVAPHIGRGQPTAHLPSTDLLTTPSTYRVIKTTLPSGIKLEKPTQKPHLYIYPMGRIGNCLFTIAAAYSLSLQYNHHLVLGNGYKYLSHSFPSLGDIPYVQIDDKLNATHMGESGFARYSFQLYQSLANLGDVLLVGYLQSFKYFSNYEQNIRKLFRFSDALVANATQILADIRTSYIEKHGPVPSVTFVGLHIRKGDMTNSGNAAIGYRTTDSDYIYKSMFYFQRKYKHVAFVLRTDTPNWSKDNLFMEAVYQPASLSAEKDLALLSLCNHTITSTGTFSWWAGWLAGGEVAYFHNPYNMSSSMAKGFVAEDFFPSHWLPVSKMSRQDIERLVETWSEFNYKRSLHLRNKTVLN